MYRNNLSRAARGTNMKSGGNTWNTSFKSKRGLKTTSKCSICGRKYKQQSTMETHEKQCKERKK